MSDKKSIVFLGDSFTWGEGLELYTDTPKWVLEREIDNSTWASGLGNKQDKDGIDFRNQNRYPALSCKKLNYDFFVDNENGGTIGRNLLVLEENLIKNKITDIVLQFSSYKRELYHLTFDCRCEFCQYTTFASPLPYILSYIEKKHSNKDNLITQKEKYIFDFISNRIGNTNIKSIKFLEDTDVHCKYQFDNQINLLSKGFFHRLRTLHNIKIHFIDSWCDNTSNILQNNGNIAPFLILLIGKDGKTYKKWAEWLQTFENKSISDDFPLCGNHHPSLEMHKYLSMSVVKHFNSFI